MSLLRTSLLLAASFATLRPTTLGQSPALTRNIPYTTDATGTYRGDLYLPPGPGPFPAVVLIHGGSWRSGNKHDFRKLATDLAARGFASFSIDYDLHPHSFPYSWQESRNAVQFLRTHASAYHVDPDHIAVLGASAGGQLAALVALAPGGPSVDPTGASAPDPPPIPVAAGVLFNGGYDLHPRVYVLRRYLGGNCDAIPAVCNDASPDDHTHPGAPPIFVGHGTHDRLIPYEQATRFIALLQAAGDPVTPFVATGAGHSYWHKRHWYSANLAATEAFLNANLRSPGPPQPTP